MKKIIFTDESLKRIQEQLNNLDKSNLAIDWDLAIEQSMREEEREHETYYSSKQYHKAIFA